MSPGLRRGSIVLASLDPATGSEAAKTRPVVVVANNTSVAAAIRHSGTVTVVPVTSNLRHVQPFHVVLSANDTGLPLDSKAQAEQVRSISVIHLGPVVGWVPTELMGALDDALRLHLAL